MAIWPFNRRRNLDPTLPAAVETYTKSEHRERMGMAWLVGVVTLLITAVVLAGLYFGGRWVYRKISGKPKTPSTTQNVPAEKDNGSKTNENAPSSNEQNSSSNSNNNNSNSDNTNSNNSTGNSSNSNSSSNPTSNSTGDSQSTANTNGKIASTGPENTLSLFVAVTVLSTLAYQYKLRRQN